MRRLSGEILSQNTMIDQDLIISVGFREGTQKITIAIPAIDFNLAEDYVLGETIGKLVTKLQFKEKVAKPLLDKKKV